MNNIRQQSWFEMEDILRRSYDDQVWIPLKSRQVQKKGESGFCHFTEEFLGMESLIVPVAQKPDAEKVSWSDLSRGRDWVEVRDSEYVSAHIFKGEISAERIVLERAGNMGEYAEWHLSNDIVIALGLKQERGVWVAIDRGYEDVVKVERDEAGCTNLILIRSSYLKDYLCARKASLYLVSYTSRTQIVESRDHIGWEKNIKTETDETDLECSISEIHEGGQPYGSETRVMSVTRTDVDYENDVPNNSIPTDGNSEAQSLGIKSQGRKLYRISGELWRKEWVNAGESSPIVLDEEEVSTTSFIISADNRTETPKNLINSRRWLWFKPGIINQILKIRGSSLVWHSKDIGSIACSSEWEVHFGVNSIGLVNVYAKDIAALPEWQRKIWVGCNISPDGKVSAELLQVQGEGKPVSTSSAERSFLIALKELDDLMKEKFGILMFRQHEKADEIFSRIHRFRADEEGGLFNLAKDIWRVVGERINSQDIKKIIDPENERLRSLKSLEKLLAQHVGDQDAYNLLSPLHGIYGLRHADTHLPSSEPKEEYHLCNIDTTKHPVVQGFQLIDCCVSCLGAIGAKIDGIVLTTE